MYIILHTAYILHTYWFCLTFNVDRGDEEEEDDDEPAMERAKEAGDDEEDEGDEDRAGKGKGNKKGKGKKDKKNKGDDDGEWEVDFEVCDAKFFSQGYSSIYMYVCIESPNPTKPEGFTPLDLNHNN